MKKGNLGLGLKLSVPQTDQVAFAKFLWVFFSISVSVICKCDCFNLDFEKFEILTCGYCCRTESGTFKDGDLLVNRDGVRIVSEAEVEAVITFLISFSWIILCFIFWIWCISFSYKKGFFEFYVAFLFWGFHTQLGNFSLVGYLLFLLIIWVYNQKAKNCFF